MKKQTNSTTKAHLRRGACYLLLLLAVCAIPFALAQRSSLPHPAAAGLTFAERVAYQTAIEGVYWRHRIWPKTNHGPKPPLDAVMSQADIEKKVEGYLHNSQALEDYWHRPITANQLQAEMDRMASDTKQPEVLQELFDALGNDPLVIAECLARPILTERLIADVSAQDQTDHLESLRSAQLRTESIAPTFGQVAYTLPLIDGPSGGCMDDTWTATKLVKAPSARSGHTAIWTGTELIVWGGGANTGGRYNPSTDNWKATSTTGAPGFRSGNTAIWTGTEMIIWGGADGGSFNTGGRYNPGTDTWTATSTTNAPTARYWHTAVWTGSEMIVWGGLTNDPTTMTFNTGGRYNPVTDNWVATSTINAPSARAFPYVPQTAVWTGSEMIVWGGSDVGSYFNTGGRYNPDTDSWTATSMINVPAARYEHTAVWTGSEMIVWGGIWGMGTGGRYNPNTDSWTATSMINAPSARYAHTAVWTGSEMIVWGGNLYPDFYDDGARYNPATDTWTATSLSNAPAARRDHTAVWTGSQMIVWGGTAADLSALNTGARYCFAASSPTPTPTPSPTPTPTATPTPTPAPTATPTPTPGQITLQAQGYKDHGLQKVDLFWNGATSVNIDIYRDDMLIATTPNDGSYTDNIDVRGGGTYIYGVCEEGTQNCSNQVTVVF